MNNGFRSPYSVLTDDLFLWFKIHYLTFRGRIVSGAYLRLGHAATDCTALNCAYNSGLLDADTEHRDLGNVPAVKNRTTSHHKTTVVSLDLVRRCAKAVPKPKRGHLTLVK